MASPPPDGSPDADDYLSDTDALLNASTQRIDKRAYSRRLRGWLSYAFASEVFAVVSLTLFLPVALESFAFENGVFDDPERSIPCNSGDESRRSEARCVVRIGWLWIDTASFSLYIYSISVALQAILVISLGTIADHPQWRKLLLLSFALLGSTSAILFIAVSPASAAWFLCALLAIVANVSFGVSTVAMNSYLPTIAKSTREVRQKAAAVERLKANATDDDYALLAGDETEDIQRDGAVSDFNDVSDPTLKAAIESYQQALAIAAARISSRGIAIGYGAGIALLLLALIPVTLMHGTTYSLRLAIFMSGIWWLVFTIPAAIWLPGGPVRAGMFWDRSGISALRGWRDPLRTSTSNRLEAESETRVWTQIKGAWIGLGRMLRPTEIAKLKNTFLFLGAWFLLSDGFTTVTSTAVLFAKTTLNLPTSSLIIIGLLTPSAGIAGSLLWPRIQKKLKFSNKNILITLVMLASLVPFYGCLGFLPVFKGRVGGLTTAGEMYGLAVYFGSVFGAFQAYARALFAEIIPHGEEARWYGLYSITDKSSSFLGPLVAGVISDLTGNMRYAFFFIGGILWFAIIPLAFVDVDAGRKDAELYVRTN